MWWIGCFGTNITLHAKPPFIKPNTHNIKKFVIYVVTNRILPWFWFIAVTWCIYSQLLAQRTSTCCVSSQLSIAKPLYPPQLVCVAARVTCVYFWSIRMYLDKKGGNLAHCGIAGATNRVTIRTWSEIFRTPAKRIPLLLIFFPTYHTINKPPIVAKADCWVLLYKILPIVSPHFKSLLVVALPTMIWKEATLLVDLVKNNWTIRLWSNEGIDRTVYLEEDQQ
jgi:hypothetical protein